MNIRDMRNNTISKAELIQAVLSELGGSGGASSSSVSLSQFTRNTGETNDNGRMTRALSYLAENKLTELNINEDIEIDATAGVYLISNLTINFNYHKITTLPNNVEWSGTLRCNGIENVEIKNGVFIGERDAHQGTTGEWGFGICFSGCSNLAIKNCSFSKFWGDGIYSGDCRLLSNTTPSKNVLISNCYFNENRRQGMSLCAGQITVEGCTVENTYGIAPSAGICIEPDWYTDCLTDITIKNFTSKNNTFALDICIHDISEDNGTFKIQVDGLQDYGSFRGIEILGVSYDDERKFPLRGKCHLENIELNNTLEIAIRLVDWKKERGNISFKNLFINNANYSEGGVCFAMNLSGEVEALLMENLYLNNPNCNNNFYIDVDNVTISNLAKNESQDSGAIRLAPEVSNIKLINTEPVYYRVYYPMEIDLDSLRNYNGYSGNFILPNTSCSDFPEFSVYASEGDFTITSEEAIFPFSEANGGIILSKYSIATICRKDNVWRIKIDGKYTVIQPSA